MKRKIFKLLKSFNYFSKSFSEVRRVLGENFISPAEVVKATRLIYTKDRLKILRKKLPSRKILEELKENNFFLMPIPPKELNLKKISYYFPNLFKNNKRWEKDSFFKNEKTDIGWIAVSKDFGQKQKEDLKVVEVLWLIIILKLTRNIDIAKDNFIGTSSKTSTRIVPKKIAVGSMPIEGLVLAVDDYNSKNINFFKFK